MRPEDCLVCHPVEPEWFVCEHCFRDFPFKWLLQVHGLTYGAKGGFCPPNRYSWTRGIQYGRRNG